MIDPAAAIVPTAVIAAESERFVAALEHADPSAVVPAAPDWTADDLLWHLTEVQFFWAAIVAGRLTDPDAAEAVVPPRPTGRTELVSLCRRATEELVAALADADDADTVWTWADDHTVGFVRRRQLHEVVVHRVDAEQTVGRTIGAIDDQVATDGVDEVLAVYVSGTPDWMTFTPDGTHVAIEVAGTDLRRTFGFGRATGTSPNTGNTYDLPALVGADGATPDATIVGASAPLLLWLWGRGPADQLTVLGDAAMLGRLREVIADATR